MILWARWEWVGVGLGVLGGLFDLCGSVGTVGSGLGLDLGFLGVFSNPHGSVGMVGWVGVGRGGLGGVFHC